jgi:homoserine dehydrogenase
MFASSTSSAPFRVGMLGHGTVGSAFAEPLDKRAAEIAQ